MPNLFWLRNTQSAIFELRPLTDYAGQPLKFTKPGTPWSRRCVTEEVRKSAEVEAYIQRQILEDEATAGKPPAPAPTPADAPEPVKAAPPPETSAEPVLIPEPKPELTPEAPVVEETSEVPAVEEPPEEKKSRKRRGRNKG